jgi:prevent-host-death family protein
MQGMKTVRIAELKARLSEYLREVRRGRAFTVLDRETPIARLVPYEEAPALTIRRPRPGAPAPGEFRWPPPLDLKVDAVALLLEERQSGR